MNWADVGFWAFCVPVAVGALAGPILDFIDYWQTGEWPYYED